VNFCCAIKADRSAPSRRKADVRDGLAGSFSAPQASRDLIRHGMPIAENRLGRRFEVHTLDSVCATDITYINTREGRLYLAVVMGLFSRCIVDWSMADHMRTSLVRGALEIALGHRVPSGELLHHSDRGSQYASWECQQVLKSRGIERHDYIEIFYNRRRRRSYLGNVFQRSLKNYTPPFTWHNSGVLLRNGGRPTSMDLYQGASWCHSLARDKDRPLAICNHGHAEQLLQRKCFAVQFVVCKS